MAQSVSNDALWEKLSEIDKKLGQFSVMKESLIPPKDQPEIKIDFGETKDDIINEIREQSSKLGTHADSNFAVVNQNCIVLDENIRKILNIASHTRKHQRETAELQKTDDTHFNFRFFKVRKSSLVIAILGLLVFILTLFCMKQQNDYTLLMDEYYRQGIVIEESDTELKVFEEQNLKKQKRNDIGKNKVQKIHDKK